MTNHKQDAPQPDVELNHHGDENGFDNLLADEVVVEWLVQLEREENRRAAAG